MTNQRFEALSRICLNNWHYINRKTLSFSEGINFFTGHSGSGKSTVIDAMQIVLYANTDGRGFFNKAAADDSDRNLIEYLRGMVNIGENNEFAYLRNQNFSTTIVLELKRTDTGECQCVGIVFDVDTGTNEISRRFFWHTGPLWENGYRLEKRAMSIDEVEDYLRENYGKEEYFATSHNERFRRILYDVYLGGLDSEKFPLLFKRAIPFRMNIRLEDFVKVYICMEQDIHIEDMQESVMQYGRMRKKIEDTCIEIDALKAMQEQYGRVAEKEEEIRRDSYFAEKMTLLELQSRAADLMEKAKLLQGDLEGRELQKQSLEKQIEGLAERSEELLRQISSTGYEDLKTRLVSLNELIEHLNKSAAKWQQTANRLHAWAAQEMTSNQTLWDIEEFEKNTIDEAKLNRLKRSIAEMRKETEGTRSDAASNLRELKRQESQMKDELAKLKAGSKAYPKYLDNARSFLQRRLLEETGKAVEVSVLADLLDIRDETWRNAVEGYLGGNKLSLVVAPAYVEAAMAIYQELDKKEYYNVAVLDTEKVGKETFQTSPGALSEEVSVREAYLQPYIDLLLGKVMKCSDVDELRRCRIGVTPDCLLYHTFRLQHMNPDNYTKNAYIGKDSVRRRIRLLEKSIAETEEKRIPEEKVIRECEAVLKLEGLSEEAPVYLEWQKDMADCREKQKEKKKLEQKLEKLKEQNVDQWEAERSSIVGTIAGKQKENEEIIRQISDTGSRIAAMNRQITDVEEEWMQKERAFETDEELEAEFLTYLRRLTGADPAGADPTGTDSAGGNPAGTGLAEENPPDSGAAGNSGRRHAGKAVRYDRLRDELAAARDRAAEEREDLFGRLVNLRGEYARRYPNRNFPLTTQENTAYDRLLEKLTCDNLAEYRQIAADQARSAVEHFKDDFMYKIRSAIRDALQRKDELNRIISRLDFGKDKYQFVIGKNRGADGRYYDMFMAESLEINPAHLNQSFDNQMNIFTMEHENEYGELINELINVFIPPENATPEQMEEAKRNMDKYADYRTYLSFDMQQLVQNEDEVIKIRLSRMIKKNSGGEGQNPLYVALLASFAQAYRISLSPRIQRNPTIRLVVLDEAFSKMDAEKVASCIELIRGLGFQAIISATNDKIQNYVENVDKTFVFANPNKKSISIQEFEKESFPELMRDLDEEDENE